MLSNWVPRSPANGQRRHPGIYSANSRGTPKRSPFRSGEESSNWPSTWSSLMSGLSGGYPETSSSLATETSRSNRGNLSFRPAIDEPQRSAYHSQSDLSFQEIAGSTTTMRRKYYCPDATATLLNDFDARYSTESRSWQSMGNASTRHPMEPLNYSTPYLPGPPACSPRDTRSEWQRTEDPGFKYCDNTSFSRPGKPRDFADDLHVCSTPSVEEWKLSKYSDTESPSTVAGASSDSHGHSSDSDAQPMRRGFNSEDSPDGSSDSDVPASSASEHPPSPEVPSLAPLSSDEVATSDESEAEPHTARVSEPASEKSQSRHPLAVIGWVGDLPLNESSDCIPRAAVPEPYSELLPPKPLPMRQRLPQSVERARGTTQNAKGLSIALDTELRSLEDEMSDLTRDLLAIKRGIPQSFSSKNADDEK